ncbi:MAG: hypothetical protein IJ412_05145 [Oscillospiraceae bacterium]|nr:hypothetical protein [Oscillospiraceae bacterium]
MKQYTKLLATAMLLLTAVVMVISTSFAWMTISKNPVAQGVQIALAGSHTVMVAPDIAVEQNGQVLHYPGEFSDTLNFFEHAQYDYLKELGGLIPVSTVNGEDWYIPTYYKLGDAEVESGQSYVGQLRPISEFRADTMLKNANLSSDVMEEDPQGHYVYLDFWVMAPVDGYKLRVSTSSESAGSFVVDLRDPVKAEAGDSYTLSGTNQQTAACMRVGFLINEDTVLNDSMHRYSQSAGFNANVTRLQGLYNEPGMGALHNTTTRFTIYEPNADLHPVPVQNRQGKVIENGMYATTEPLGPGGVAIPVADRLTVQLTNSWNLVGEETKIEQMFRTFMAGRNPEGETTQSLKEKFYVDSLQYQIYPYVTKGNFITRSQELYAAAGDDKIAGASDLSALHQSGATEDVYLTQLTGGVPQRIRMFVWLEGQDMDCINKAALGSFAVSIELAGSNAS